MVEIMNEELIMLFLSAATLGVLVYVYYLLNDCSKILDRMLKRSKRMMKKLDESINEK